MRAAVGLAMQRFGLSEGILLRRSRYVLPFYASSNMALTLWTLPHYSDQTEQFVHDYLRPGDVFVDVGANVGCISATAAARVGNSGRVIALEPHPVIYRYLCRTVVANGLTNVECLNMAAGNRTGCASLTSEWRKDDSNRIIETKQDGLNVAMCKVADIVRERQLGRIALIKVDVEGYEEQVLSGMEDVLGQVDCIHLESIERLLNRHGSSRRHLVNKLRGNGFTCFRLRDDRSNLLAFADTRRAEPWLHELVEIGGHR